MDYWGKPGVAQLCRSLISCDYLGKGWVRWTIEEKLGLRSSDKGSRSDDQDLNWTFWVSGEREDTFDWALTKLRYGGVMSFEQWEPKRLTEKKRENPFLSLISKFHYKIAQHKEERNQDSLLISTLSDDIIT